MLRRIATDESGNIITVLGISALTLLGAASASLDYTRMTNTRAALSAAADAAALAAAQAPSDKADTIARQVFDANFRDMARVTAFTATQFKRGEDTGYRVEATADVEMTLSKIMGSDSRLVRSLSEVIGGSDRDVQMALVLDVTGSMAGTKLTSLKTSATTMVNTLFDKLNRPNQLKIAVVPFAEYVNVGLSNRSKPWLSVPPDTTTSQNVCWMTRDVTSKSNCRNELHTWNSCSDGVCTPYSELREVCDYTYGPEYQTCGISHTTVQWNGCVGSRNYPLNVRDESYIAQPVPGLMNQWCNAPLTPLSTNRFTVLGAIGVLGTAGETYIPAGLMWGWATLSPGEPFDEPVDASRTTRRHLVLMTDGDNTIAPTYPHHWDRSPSVANRLTEELCTNIKAAGIEIFTIAFEVTNGTTKNMMRNCASSNDNYFDASDATQLASAFETIAGQVSSLRLVR